MQRLLFACLVIALAGCNGAKPASPVKQAEAVKLSANEQELMTIWQKERGLSSGDALSNVMLRRYENSGHPVRYAGGGLYEVMDKKAAKTVVATFFVRADVK